MIDAKDVQWGALRRDRGSELQPTELRRLEPVPRSPLFAGAVDSPDLTCEVLDHDAARNRAGREVPFALEVREPGYKASSRTATTL